MVVRLTCELIVFIIPPIVRMVLVMPQIVPTPSLEVLMLNPAKTLAALTQFLDAHSLLEDDPLTGDLALELRRLAPPGIDDTGPDALF